MINFEKAFYINGFHRADLLVTDLKSDIVVVGRSNVGKSTFINALTNKKKIAYVSKKPGKTLCLHLFDIDATFYLVDVPGYGYANVPKSTKYFFANVMENYFNDRNQIDLVVMLLDIRRVPNQDDLQMQYFLQSKNVNILYVATKLDKVNQSQLHHGLKDIATKLKISQDEIIPYSAKTLKNLDQIKEKITFHLN